MSTLEAVALAADLAEDLVVGTVRDVHGAVAGRVRGLTDRLHGGIPTIGHRVHDGVAKVVYAGISSGVRAGAQGLRHAGRSGLGGPLEATARGRRATAVLNGLIGDRLRDEASPISFDLAVRLDAHDVVLEQEEVAAAFPGATKRVVVFLHGLVENEELWRRPAAPTREVPDRRSYGERLVEEGWTPVFLRLNTGLSLAENGVATAALMQRLLECWPVAVDRVALVGHSMGGLVARAACAVSTDRVERWTERVTDVVCLGTPHLGAPLERVVHRGVGALGRLPESAPFGRILEYRSIGILGLRHGLARDVVNLPHARYRMVGATLTRSSRSLSAATLGDLLVPFDSAVGRRRGGAEMFPGAEVLHVPGADHFDLLNHDDVYAALREWLLDRSDPPTREATDTG